MVSQVFQVGVKEILTCGKAEITRATEENNKELASKRNKIGSSSRVVCVLNPGPSEKTYVG